MKGTRIKVALAVSAAGVLGVAATALANDHGSGEKLTGYEEVPALSTPGIGQFSAKVARSGDEIRYRLSYHGLESGATQAHIHFENQTNNGPIIVFLCSNLGNGPAGTQACPTQGGTISGTIRASDIGGVAPIKAWPPASSMSSSGRCGPGPPTSTFTRPAIRPARSGPSSEVTTTTTTTTTDHQR